ncbi:2,3-diaminopropionate biosynthesis protein SbnB [Paraburkholderia sp. MM5482-R1]|uniref:2,3-diaminopropionate biosynthesis protein SbnB n=1 Tax=unclassified Paraburkholderia TaxID=2615204 RepID=UPI003D257AEC
MNPSSIRLLSSSDVENALHGQEARLIDTVSRAYDLHASGASSLPHSTFLRMPDNTRDRIIALPAYLGGEFDVAGIKWIASFPGNVEKDVARASAVIILNDMDTGFPFAIMEGGTISAKRTAASAALAAKLLSDAAKQISLGFIGCGRINREVASFLRTVFGRVNEIRAFDSRPNACHGFLDDLQGLYRNSSFVAARSVGEILSSTDLIAIATTASQPHISDLSRCKEGAVILHLSLRDITPDAILRSRNIVDDTNHVSREQTSIHLAEMQCGHRQFIHGTIADLIHSNPEVHSGRKFPVAIFSPFGLGVLDLASACLALELAEEKGLVSQVGFF